MLEKGSDQFGIAADFFRGLNRRLCQRGRVLCREVRQVGPLHLITVTNSKDDSLPIPIPPTPDPPVDSLEFWVVKNTPLLVKSAKFETEKVIVAKCFADVGKRVDSKNILTPQNAFTQLQLCLRNNLSRSSSTAINDWSEFLEKLGREMENSVGENGKDINQIRKTFRVVQTALEEKQ